jgi:hypothetical protein
VNDARGRYLASVYLLSAIGAACAALILYGEAFGGPARRDLWQLGGAALGLIFVVYGFILLLLRKAGVVAPRRAEAEDDLRGRWVKPVP